MWEKNTPIVLMGFASIAMTGFTSSTWGALTIMDADIVAGNYKFTMLYSEIGPAVSPDPGSGNFGHSDPATSKFNNTVFASQNMFAAADGTGAGERRFVYATNTASSAYATFKFDFSNTNYVPTSVSWGKRFNIDPQSPNTNAVRTKIEWSYDNLNWINIFTSNDPQDSTPYRDGGYSQDFNPMPSVELTGTNSVVYYRVSFDAATGTNGLTPTSFTGRTVQWGRLGSTNDWNVADFTLAEAPAVPEPAGIATLGAGFAGMLLRRRRGIKMASPLG